jgi:hypothetical protein
LINGFTPHVGDQFTIIGNQGTNPVSGTFAGLPEGATFIVSGYQFQVSYAGGTDHQDVTLTVTRVATTTSVTSSVDPSDLDQSVTFTATVAAVPAGAAAPTGSVQFQVDGVNLGAAVPLSGGSASITTAALAAGPHTITVLYNGDAYSLPSSASLPQNVRAPIASAGGPYTIREGDSVTLDASGSSDPGGSSLTYSWDLNGDGVFGDATGVRPTLTWSQLEALGINDGPATFNVQVQVTNAYGGSTISPATTLTVSDAPVSNLQLTLQASSINEGSSASLSGSFTNPSAVDANSVVINWGDGSANTTLNLAAGATSFSGITHQYLEESAGQPGGSYPISVIVQDNEGAQASASTSIQVSDAPLTPSGKAVTPVTGSSFAGVVASFTDADPNGTAGDYTATITWGDGQTSAGTIAANGSGGFNVSGTNTYAADGIYAITVTITDAGGSTATASTTAYVGGLAKHLSVTAATAETAGTPFPVTVAALDANGNPAYNYTGTVQFTSTDANAVLPANYTFSAGDLGTHVFNVTLETAGTHSVTATDTVTSTLTGKQTGIVVSPGAVSQLQVVTSVSSVTAGKALSVTITAQDAYGNTVTNYSGTVHFTSTDAQAGLPADYTFVPGTDNGVHKFAAAVALKTAGSQKVTASDTSNGSVTGTSAAVTVSPANATHFALSAPASVSVGVAFSFTVTALDDYGNVATGYVGTVHFTSSDGLAVLPVDYTFQASDAGVATFQATLNTTGVQSLTATDTKHKTITGEDASIQVS